MARMIVSNRKGCESPFSSPLLRLRGFRLVRRQRHSLEPGPTLVDMVTTGFAVSFEAAEWSERLTPRRAGWLGAAAIGSIPALVTFFFFSSLLLLFLSSLSKS